MRVGHFLLVCMATAGCTDEVVERGVLEAEPGAAARIEAPTSAAVGVSFFVKFETTGGGCVSFDSTHVGMEGSNTLIEPYDRVKEGGCTLILKHFDHSVALKFDVAGDQQIVIRGRRFYGSTATEAVIDYVVTVSIN